MTYSKQMLETYPRTFNVDMAMLANAIDAAMECSQACTACADACLSEENVGQMVKCIRTNLDCADVCAITAKMLSRQTEYDANMTRAMLEACMQACRSCADMCSQHAEMAEHCAVCADACRRCEAACKDLMMAMA